MLKQWMHPRNHISLTNYANKVDKTRLIRMSFVKIWTRCMKRKLFSNMKETSRSITLTILYRVSSLRVRARKLWYIFMRMEKTFRWHSLWWTSWYRNWESILFAWSILATVYTKIKRISTKLRPNRGRSRFFRMLRRSIIS